MQIKKVPLRQKGPEFGEAEEKRDATLFLRFPPFFFFLFQTSLFLKKEKKTLRNDLRAFRTFPNLSAAATVYLTRI